MMPALPPYVIEAPAPSGLSVHAAVYLRERGADIRFSWRGATPVSLPDPRSQPAGNGCKLAGVTGDVSVRQIPDRLDSDFSQKDFLRLMREARSNPCGVKGAVMDEAQESAILPSR